jgi:hypothetical protein
MKTWYAESHGQSITKDIYEGDFLRYAKDSEPYCDLYRFYRKSERDAFVVESPETCNSIGAKQAMLDHKDQFSYWLDQEK